MISRPTNQGSGWWQLSIWNGDGKITNQHPAQEIWQEILQEIMREMFWKMLHEMLWEMLQEMLWHMMGGKSLFKKGRDWWNFGIWNRVMGSSPISIQLGKSSRKFCWKSCRKFCWRGCRKSSVGNAAGNLVGNFLNLSPNQFLSQFSKMQVI